MVNCKQCHQTFAITTSDQLFYKKLAVPEPTLCPSCRLQRRLIFRNESRLHQRSCDLCHKSIIAMYPANAPFPVYCPDCWWSDQWDPLAYGRDIDWNRPFFEQFHELSLAVPKAGVIQLQNENSPYNALLAFSKNTYMSPGSYLMENCYYVRKSQHCRDCVNSIILNKCELVANSMNCDNCYQSHHLVNSKSCSFSSYLQDCSGIQHGFMCSGVRNQNYCFKNKVYPQLEYEAILQQYAAKSEAELLVEFKAFCLTIPKRDQIQTNCEQSTGDYLFNCHHANDCFDCFDIEDSSRLLECSDIKDSMDLSMHDKEVSLCYELCSGGEKTYLTKFSFCPVDVQESEYTISCFHANNCFGCEQIHTRTAYCILNKRYTKDEYMGLRARLIEHMKQTGEYGEFFPAQLSPFAYNDSAAQTHLPLTEHEAKAQGFIWNNTVKTTQGNQQASLCTSCQKPFRVIEQEQALYTKLVLPKPTVCLECRYQQLLQWKNPMHLYKRSCQQCNQPIQTTYPPTRQEVVLCANCYRQMQG